jgi:hydrogenase/urease accessory protein HupE
VEVGDVTRARFRTLVVGGAIVLLGQVGDAHAHLVSTDLGPFYDGFTHAFVSPRDALVILGLAILASFAGPPAGRKLLASLVVAWGVGACLAYGLAAGLTDWPVATAATLVLLGLIALLAIRLPAGLLVAAGVLIGLAHGAMNGSAARDAGGPWLAVAGVAAGVFVLGTLASGLGQWMAGRPAVVVLRVAGSWIAAIGLLMIGWQIRG